MRSGAGGAESLVLGNQAKRSPILGLSRADTQQPCTVGRGDRACWEVTLEGHPELGRLLTLSHRDLRGRKVDVLGPGAEGVISPREAQYQGWGTGNPTLERLHQRNL